MMLKRQDNDANEAWLAELVVLANMRRLQLEFFRARGLFPEQRQ
jgi:hypothetical protein